MSGSLPNERANDAEITLRLPWHVAEYLADHAAELLEALEQVVGRRRRWQESERAEAKRFEAEREARRRWWRQLGRHAYRRVGLLGFRVPKDRCRVIALLAGELSERPQVIDQAERMYATAFRRRLRQRRNRQIYRLYCQGLLNGAICKAIASWGYKPCIGPARIGAIIAREKKRRRQTKRPDRPTNVIRLKRQAIGGNR